MKRTAYILSIAMLALAACNTVEPETTKVEPAQITVKSSDVIFDAVGGNGTITIEAQGAVTATSASDWCKVSVSGNTVNVTADPNNTIDGRASRITLTCNGETVGVTAQQYGMTFSFLDNFYTVPMLGGKVTITGKSTFPVTVEASADWLNVKEVEGGYEITVPENGSGDSRTGTFTITGSGINSVCTIKQLFDRNFEGNYTLTFYTNSGLTATGSCNVAITKDENDDKVYWMEGFLDAVVPVKLVYDTAKELLYVPNCSYLYQHSDGNYVYALCNYLNGTSSYMSYSLTDLNYAIYFSYTYDGATRKYTLDLYNSGQWFSRTSAGFLLYTFTVAPNSDNLPSVTLSSTTRKSSIKTVRYPKFTAK